MWIFYEDIHHAIHSGAEARAEGGSKNASLFIYKSCVLFVCIGFVWPFECFPEWTVWIFCILLIIWDLWAVLAPFGPLRYAMYLDRQRRLGAEKEFKLPHGLVYEGYLFQLGTGDFIFYGVIVARAVCYNSISTIFTTIALLFGIVLTILWTLESNRHAIPALPIALTFGIAAYFVSRYCTTEFLSHIVFPYVRSRVTNGSDVTNSSNSSLVK